MHWAGSRRSEKVGPLSNQGLNLFLNRDREEGERTMPQWYSDWLVSKLIPLALRGSWEVGIDPLEKGYEPRTDPEEHGVGIVGRWALRWPDPPPACNELKPSDYAMFFWYVIEGEHRIVTWQVLGKTVFSHTQAQGMAEPATA